MTLNDAIRLLSDAGIASPKNDAVILAESFCGASRASIVSAPDADLAAPEFICAVQRRAKREPLQYILKHWYFMNEEYEVSPNCLIPRADTELIAEQAIKLLRHGGKLLDLCCGSGCIGISVLAARPDCCGDGVDIFPETLALAKRNSEKNGVSSRIKFHKVNVLFPSESKLQGSYDIIVSNPPYIRTSELSGLDPELAHEPQAALDGGEDGLIFYRAILDLWLDLLAPEGTLIFEIGYDQGADLEKLATDLGLSCEILQDLSGLDLAARIKRLY